MPHTRRVRQVLVDMSGNAHFVIFRMYIIYIFTLAALMRAALRKLFSITFMIPGLPDEDNVLNTLLESCTMQCCQRWEL